MSDSVKDAKTRALALDPKQSFIVQAPAGSGKTRLLIERYLTLLARAQAPEEILAITFTRKATAEMRDRIIAALKSADQDSQIESGTPEEIVKLAGQALKQSERQNWDLLNNTRRLRVQTIDAFCNELVRRTPWSAQFGAAPGIIENAGELYRLAAINTLSHIDQNSAVAEAAAVLLELIDTHFEQAIELLVEMLAKRDKWLRLLPGQNRVELEKTWCRIVEQQLLLIDQNLSLPLRHRLTRLSRYAASQLLEANTNCQQPLCSCHEMSEFPLPQVSAIEQWRGIADLLMTKTGTLRKTVDKRNGFPTSDREAKNDMLELLEQLSNDPQLSELLPTLQGLPNGVFSDAQWRSLEALFNLLPVAVAELQILFKQRGAADYTEISQRAALALGETDAPTDLALLWDYKLCHVLMDEFQDTSRSQYRLLEALTEGWTENDGRTLFVVGDPMQSIYRFRQAEVALFLQLAERGIGQVRLESIQLSCNFRSDPRIINWVNTVFDQLMPDKNDTASGAVQFAPGTATKERTETGAVELHPFGDPARSTLRTSFLLVMTGSTQEHFT